MSGGDELKVEKLHFDILRLCSVQALSVKKLKVIGDW
jgi:hypothetical protein